MKVKKDLVISKLGSRYVVVPVGEASVQRHFMVNMNETGAFLWKALQTPQTLESLVDALMEEYEVDRATAAQDVEGFVSYLRTEDLLDD